LSAIARTRARARARTPASQSASQAAKSGDPAKHIIAQRRFSFASDRKSDRIFSAP